MNRIIRGLRAALAPLWEPEVIDLTRPGAASTPREFQQLQLAAMTVARVGYTRKLAPVVHIDELRMQRQAREVSLYAD